MNVLYAFLISMGFGFIIDLYTCVYSIKVGLLLTKGDSLKRLINTIVYGTGGFLLYLISLIGIFSLIRFAPLFMLIGAIVCTGVELTFGVLINIFLYKWTKFKLWDYSHSKFNFMGQIDLAHFFGWGLLSIAVLIFFKMIF